MSRNNDVHPPSFTEMTFDVASGRGSVHTVHDPVSEIKRLYEDIENQVDELRNNQNQNRLQTVVDETTLPRDLRQNVVSFYALSVGVIESYSAELLLREVVDDDFSDSNKTRKFFEEETSVSKSVKMLMYFGIVDNGLHGELNQVIERRNEYVHQHNESLIIVDYNDFLTDAKRAVRSTKKLAIELDGQDYRNWSI